MKKIVTALKGWAATAAATTATAAARLNRLAEAWRTYQQFVRLKAKSRRLSMYICICTYIQAKSFIKLGVGRRHIHMRPY